MNKETFLHQLRTALHPLPTEDIAEIVEDYALLIEEQLLEGKTEEAIIQSLGSPKEIAHTHKEELLGDIPLEKEEQQKKQPGLFIVMQVLNVLLVGWLFVAGAGFILSFAIMAITLLLTSPTYLFSWMDLSFLFKLSLGFINVGIGLLVGSLTIVLGKYYYNLIRKYILWNISLIR